MDKKKILFVINHFRFLNGVATALRNIIANLDENKYEISLLAIYEFDEEFAKPVINKIKVIRGYNFYFRGFDKLVNLIPPKYIYKKFIKEKYDLEIAFQYGTPTKCIAVSDNPHKLCWMHGYDTKMVLKKYYKMFPKIVNVAKIGREKLIESGFEPEKVEYCYNIIDEQKIVELSKENINMKKTHKYIVITVARLTPEKAFMRYLKCIKNIVKENNEVEFWIVGGGSEEEKMKQFIKNNQLENVVKMFGKQKNPYKYMSKADLYFCSSYREGFSTACQEAAILGIPVVSVEVDGAKELIELAEAGTVILNNEIEITDKINKIICDDELIKKWKETAYKNKSKFYKEERIKKLENIIYKEVTNEKF